MFGGAWAGESAGLRAGGNRPSPAFGGATSIHGHAVEGDGGEGDSAWGEGGEDEEAAVRWRERVDRMEESDDEQTRRRAANAREHERRRSTDSEGEDECEDEDDAHGKVVLIPSSLCSPPPLFCAKKWCATQSRVVSFP